MTDSIKEQISALVDGELPASERELLLRRMESDPALRQMWRRYQLIHDTLHRDLPEQVDTGFSERVMRAIDNEHIESLPLAVRLARLARPLAGLAVAASVAAMVIVGVQRIGTDTGIDTIPVATTASMPRDGFRQVSGTRWDTQQPEVQARLNSYLVNHNEYSAATSIQGILQYRRIVGYDAVPARK